MENSQHVRSYQLVISTVVLEYLLGRQRENERSFYLTDGKEDSVDLVGRWLICIVFSEG